MISVLLVDDNGEMLTDLRDELSDEFEIAGTAENGEEAVREVLRLDPDVLVLDLNMPVMNGLQVTSLLREKHPRTKILILTIHEEPEYVSASFCAGARAYLTKRRLGSDLRVAIRETYNGRKFLSPSLQE